MKSDCIFQHPQHMVVFLSEHYWALRSQIVFSIWERNDNNFQLNQGKKLFLNCVYEWSVGHLEKS